VYLDYVTVNPVSATTSAIVALSGTPVEIVGPLTVVAPNSGYYLVLDATGLDITAGEDAAIVGSGAGFVSFLKPDLDEEIDNDINVQIASTVAAAIPLLAADNAVILDAPLLQSEIAGLSLSGSANVIVQGKFSTGTTVDLTDGGNFIYLLGGLEVTGGTPVITLAAGQPALSSVAIGANNTSIVKVGAVEIGTFTGTGTLTTGAGVSALTITAADTPSISLNAATLAATLNGGAYTVVLPSFTSNAILAGNATSVAIEAFASGAGTPELALNGSGNYVLGSTSVTIGGSLKITGTGTGTVTLGPNSPSEIVIPGGGATLWLDKAVTIPAANTTGIGITNAGVLKVSAGIALPPVVKTKGTTAITTITGAWSVTGTGFVTILGAATGATITASAGTAVLTAGTDGWIDQAVGSSNALVLGAATTINLGEVGKITLTSDSNPSKITLNNTAVILIEAGGTSLGSSHAGDFVNGAGGTTGKLFPSNLGTAELVKKTVAGKLAAIEGASSGAVLATTSGSTVATINADTLAE
jgi:hypothetical protein